MSLSKWMLKKLASAHQKAAGHGDKVLDKEGFVKLIVRAAKDEKPAGHKIADVVKKAGDFVDKHSGKIDTGAKVAGYTAAAGGVGLLGATVGAGAGAAAQQMRDRNKKRRKYAEN